MRKIWTKNLGVTTLHRVEKTWIPFVCECLVCSTYERKTSSRASNAQTKHTRNVEEQMSPWGEKGRERHKHTRSLCMSAAVNVSVFKGLYCCRQNMPWTNTPLRCERIRDGCLFTVSSVFVCAYGVDSCPFHSVHFRCALFTMHFPHRFGFRSFLNLNAEWHTVYTVNLLCVWCAATSCAYYHEPSTNTYALGARVYEYPTRTQTQPNELFGKNVRMETKTNYGVTFQALPSTNKWILYWSDRRCRSQNSIRTQKCVGNKFRDDYYCYYYIHIHPPMIMVIDVFKR